MSDISPSSPVQVAGISPFTRASAGYGRAMRPFTRSAALYDLIYEEQVDYDWHAAGLRAHILGRRADASSLLEMACGTGQVLSRMAGLFEVAGCDHSQEMIAICRRRHPELDVRVADYVTVDYGRTFHALICVFSSLAYMDTEAKLGRALDNFARHLEPGGVVVIDGWLRPEHAIDRYKSVETHEGEGVILTRSALTFVRDGRTEMIMGHTLVTDDRIEYFEEVHSMGLYADRVYLDALGDSGFTDLSVEAGFEGRGRFVGVKR